MNKKITLGKRKKHILLISQYFYPETFRVNDMAVEWVKRGYKVTVLTGIPNYPMGKFFDGYDYKHRRHEVWNGVNIIRIPLIPRGNSSNRLLNAIGMSANYLSFVASGRHWVKSAQAGELNADLIFTVEVSPMTQALIGCWYGKKYDVRVFLYVQDLWPENVETVTGIHNKVLLGLIGKMIDWIYEHTDQIFTTSPSFVIEIIKRGVSKRKVHYWPQYAEEFYEPIERDKAIEELKSNRLASLVQKVDGGAFNIAFTGNIGTAQGLGILPKVAERFKDENRLSDFHSKRICFIIVGDGRYQSTLEREISDRGVENMFIFIPRQPAEKIPAILALCDAAFLSFSNDKLWEMTIPAKLQSYMACGMPIIAAAGGETKRVITEAGCGVCSPIADVDALVDVINQMIRSDLKVMSANSREYAENNFKKQLLMDEIDAYFHEEAGRQLSQWQGNQY